MISENESLWSAIEYKCQYKLLLIQIIDNIIFCPIGISALFMISYEHKLQIHLM